MIFLSLAGAFARNAALTWCALHSPISTCFVPLPSTKNRKEGADKSDVSYLGISSTPQKFSHPQLGPSAILSTKGTRHTAAEMKCIQPNHLPPSLPDLLSSQLGCDWTWADAKRPKHCGPLSLTGIDLEYKIEPRINTPTLSSLFVAY